MCKKNIQNGRGGLPSATDVKCDLETVKVVFEESIKESDGQAIMTMLRRVRDRFVEGEVSCELLKVSVDIDVDRINMAGMTALHQVEKQSGISSCFFALSTSFS